VLKLIIEDDEKQKTVVPFVKQEITIGRQPGNTIRLTERNVSRRHARLVRENGHVLLEDLGSYNGTRVNGEQLDGKRILRERDLIRIGDYELSLQSEDVVVVAANGPLPNHANHAARLVALNTSYAGREFICAGEEVRIGRDPDCDIFIDLRSLAKTDVQMIRTPEGWEIGAVQGHPLVNGKPVDRALLQSGDVVALGKLELKFVGPGKTVQLVPISSPKPSRERRWIALALVLFLVGLAAVADRILNSSQQTLAPNEPAPSPQGAQKLASSGLPSEGKDWSAPPPAIGLGQETNEVNRGPKPVPPAATPRVVLPPPSTSRRKEARPPKTVAALRRSEPDAEESRRLYQQGAELLGANQLSEAAMVLNQCVKLKPPFARCHRMLGATYARLNDPERGAIHYRKYVQLAPDDPESIQVRVLLEQYEATRGLSKQE
jgi:pSer/pThr/pTyr-binding forkhead associated (FHA) protein